MNHTRPVSFVLSSSVVWKEPFCYEVLETDVICVYQF